MVKQDNLKKIVFIADDKEMVRVYNSVLQKKSLSDYLIYFNNATDGINYLKRTEKDKLPDYILLDLYLPEVTGFEFLKQIEKLEKVNNNIEIYVCSSSKNKDDITKVMKYPFVNAFIQKPISGKFLEFLITDKFTDANNSTS